MGALCARAERGVVLGTVGLAFPDPESTAAASPFMRTGDLVRELVQR